MTERSESPLTPGQLELMRVTDIEAASALAAQRMHADLEYDMSGDPDVKNADPQLVSSHLLIMRGVSRTTAKEQVPFPKPPYFGLK